MRATAISECSEAWRRYLAIKEFPIGFPSFEETSEGLLDVNVKETICRAYKEEPQLNELQGEDDHESDTQSSSERRRELRRRRKHGVLCGLKTTSNANLKRHIERIHKRNVVAKKGRIGPPARDENLKIDAWFKRFMKVYDEVCASPEEYRTISVGTDVTVDEQCTAFDIADESTANTNTIETLSSAEIESTSASVASDNHTIEAVETPESSVDNGEVLYFPSPYPKSPSPHPPLELAITERNNHVINKRLHQEHVGSVSETEQSLGAREPQSLLPLPIIKRSNGLRPNKTKMNSKWFRGRKKAKCAKCQAAKRPHCPYLVADRPQPGTCDVADGFDYSELTNVAFESRGLLNCRS